MSFVESVVVVVVVVFFFLYLGVSGGSGFFITCKDFAFNSRLCFHKSFFFF